MIERSLGAGTRFAVVPILLRLGKFLTVGGAGLCVDLTIFTLVHFLGYGIEIARVISIGSATIATWQLNRRFTFAPSGRAKIDEFSRYVCVVFTVQGLNFTSFLALTTAMPKVAPQICLLCTAVACAGFSFTAQSLFAFAGRRDFDPPRKPVEIGS